MCTDQLRVLQSIRTQCLNTEHTQAASLSGPAPSSWMLIDLCDISVIIGGTCFAAIFISNYDHAFCLWDLKSWLWFNGNKGIFKLSIWLFMVHSRYGNLFRFWISDLEKYRTGTSFIMENFDKNTLLENHIAAPPNPNTHPSTLILICFIDEPSL